MDEKSNYRRVAEADTWRPLYKFDCMPRQLAEFQPRCAEYQTARETVLLAGTPVIIIRVRRAEHLVFKYQLILLPS